jgi:hypothetical protein
MGVMGRAERGWGILFQRGGVGMLARSVWQGGAHGGALVGPEGRWGG